MWPELVAEKLNLNSMNIGKSGQGNSLIINDTIRTLIDHQENVEAVMILLSGWDRAQLFNGNCITPIHVICNILYDRANLSRSLFFNNDLAQDSLIHYVNSFHNFFVQLYKDSIKQTLTAVYTLIHLCESLNIKYVFAQGVDNWDHKNLDKIYDNLPSQNKINIKYH